MKHHLRAKWWGWGDEHKRFDIEHRPQLWPFLQRLFAMPDRPVLAVPAATDFAIPASRLLAADISLLEQIAGDEHCSLLPEVRLSYALGKSYHDLIRLRYRQLTAVPDAIVFPQTETQIWQILQWAVAERIAIVPFGGGTSVVGGVEAVAGPLHRALVVVCLTQMDKIVSCWPDSLLVEAQAGISGPVLENYLAQQGFTLGHFPESFEYSTLGGWVASRSAGQFSTRYGKIEDLVQSVRMVTPGGILETAGVPASACGPDLKQLVVGSEGSLGIISQARLKICPAPRKKFYRAYLFRDFESGIQAVQRLLTQGTKPTLVRLLDGAETELALALAKWPTRPIPRVLANLFLRGIAMAGFSAGKRSLGFFGLEGNQFQVNSDKQALRQTLQSSHTFALGKTPVSMWYKHRYDNPYLRDELLDYGLLVDTLETATTWRMLLPLYYGVREKIQATLTQLQIPGLVMAHISHVYETGSSLYLIILAQPKLGTELAVWQQLKNTASEAILQQGGVISHHHGIGLDHAVWLKRQLDPVSQATLVGLKNSLDPAGILNPGKMMG